jgi:vancomycin permeability regulator SanA
MNTIPEGKEQIWTEAVYKEPIEGIPYSNVGLTVGVSKYIEQGSEREEIEKVIQTLVEQYFVKLAEDIRSIRNELMDKLRVEIAEEYDEKLAKAKELILKQREEIKEMREHI